MTFRGRPIAFGMLVAPFESSQLQLIVGTSISTTNISKTKLTDYYNKQQNYHCQDLDETSSSGL